MEVEQITVKTFLAVLSAECLTHPWKLLSAGNNRVDIIVCKSTVLLAAMVLPSVRWAMYFTLWLSTVKGDNLVFLSELSKSTTLSGIFEKSIDLNSKWVLWPGCRVHANSSIIPFCNPNLSVLWFILRYSRYSRLGTVIIICLCVDVSNYKTKSIGNLYIIRSTIAYF